MKNMSSLERIRCVLEGKLPDRVPVLLQNFLNTAYLAGMKIGDFCKSANLMADAQLAAWERFRYDFIDLENGTAAMAEALGCEVDYPVDEPPRVVKPVLVRLDEITSLPDVDPSKDGHLPELLDAIHLVRRGISNRACIIGEADQAPFSLAALLFGIENWLVALMDPRQHKAIYSLLEYCYRQVLCYSLALAKAGADFIEIGDSLAGPDVCSPRIYREFAWPYEKRLAAELSERNIRLILHICGNATSIISDMAATGVAMLEIDYKIDPIRCRDATQDRCTLVGTIDPSGIMTMGSPEQVMEYSRRAIYTLGKQGRFILSPGCSLPAIAPAENTEALVKAAECFGRYGKSGLLINLKDNEQL